MTFLRAIPCPAVSPRRSFSVKMGALQHVWPALSFGEDNGGRAQYAAQQGIKEDEALESGLKAKAKEITDKGAEVYAEA